MRTMFTFSCKFNTVFGFGAISETGKKVKELGCSKALIICDEGIVRFGLLKKLTDVLDQDNIEYTVFDKVLPNPRRSGVDAAVELAKKETINCFIAIGGGSTIDTAKAANVFLFNPDDTGEDPGTMKSGFPLIAIPTTSGTGSDQSQGGMISDDVTHKKLSVNSEQPTVSICDPDLTMTLPKVATLVGAVDALAHALESYTSIAANKYTDMICENAITAVAKYLPALMEDGNNKMAREEIMFAASSMGRVICIAVPHYGHSIGHEIGGMLDIVHGLSVITVAPQMLKILAPAIPERVRRIGELLGMQIPVDADAETIGTLVRDGLVKLLRGWGVQNLREMGCKLEELHAYVPAIMQDFMLSFAPVPATAEIIKDILTFAYEF